MNFRDLYIVTRSTRHATVFAVLLLCVIFSGTAFGQQSPPPKLDDKAVTELLGRLEDSLAQLIDDEPVVEQIVERWAARDDLAGKSRPQVLKLLFTDVQAVIADKPTLEAIWTSWTGEKSLPKQDEDQTALVPHSSTEYGDSRAQTVACIC